MARRVTEALVRWNHPERGLPGPGAFLAAVAATGLDARLDTLVLRRVAGQVARHLPRALAGSAPLVHVPRGT